MPGAALPTRRLRRRGEDSTIAAIQERIAEATHLSPHLFEPMQVRCLGVALCFGAGGPLFPYLRVPMAEACRAARLCYARPADFALPEWRAVQRAL